MRTCCARTLLTGMRRLGRICTPLAACSSAAWRCRALPPFLLPPFLAVRTASSCRFTTVPRSTPACGEVRDIVGKAGSNLNQ